MPMEPRARRVVNQRGHPISEHARLCSHRVPARVRAGGADADCLAPHASAILAGGGERIETADYSLNPQGFSGLLRRVPEARAELRSHSGGGGGGGGGDGTGSWHPQGSRRLELLFEWLPKGGGGDTETQQSCFRMPIGGARHRQEAGGGTKRVGRGLGESRMAGCSRCRCRRHAAAKRSGGGGSLSLVEASWRRAA